MQLRGTIALAVTALLALVLGSSPLAYAYDEAGSGYACGDCHMYPSDTTTTGQRYGPHGHYLTTTSRCTACHTLHDAPAGGDKLLPGATVKATCLTCHDGSATTGGGVYGTLEARLGLGAVKSDHSIESTNVVRGGDAATGGSLAMTFGGPGDTLTCSDCHSPHANDCVTPFLGERQRARDFGRLTVQTQNRLLKRQPGPALTPVNDYGSDWCAACHAGRPSGLAGVHNHPVETDASQAGTFYTYRELGIIGVAPYPTEVTVLGPAGINTKVAGYNRAYLMPYPRVGAQLGHYPICQQCHEDARNVGSLDATGTGASPSAAVVSSPVDGFVATNNPRFQSFPHETTNSWLLVETSDDLCTNCHPPAALP